MHIAALEDDAAQGGFIQSLLEDAGYRCTLFALGREVLASLSKPNDFNALLLDWEIPDLSGVEVLRWVRANLGHDFPVMFVTSRMREADLVMGLRAGADDYMVKPVRTGEFLARLGAMARRLAPAPTPDTRLRYGFYEFDPHSECVWFKGEPIPLARKEFELALLFFRNPSRLFSRDVLASTIWNRDIPPTSRTIDTHLSNIRRKLQLRAENGVRLSSSYALGYRLDFLPDTIQAADP